MLFTPERSTNACANQFDIKDAIVEITCLCIEVKLQMPRGVHSFHAFDGQEVTIKNCLRQNPLPKLSTVLLSFNFCTDDRLLLGEHFLILQPNIRLRSKDVRT